MAPYIIRCPQISGYIHEKIVGTLDTETNGGGRPGQCKQLDIYVKREEVHIRKLTELFVWVLLNSTESDDKNIFVDGCQRKDEVRV